MRNTSEPTTTTRRHPECLPPPGDATHGSGYRPRYLNGCTALVASAIVLGALLHAVPARAVEFGEDGYQGSLDTTLSHGMTFRVEKRNDTLAEDINGNDGDLNYGRGMVSNVSKFTTDLDIRTSQFGAFLRTTGFFDFENQDDAARRTPLSDAAKELVSQDLEVLDAYVTAAFDAGATTFDVRLGKHVLNWGESTFIPNGINAINPFDVSKLTRPGSELREALLPIGLVSAAVAPTDTLSLEAFYQFDWEETRIHPVGSYFSSVDYAGPGARKAVITTVMEGLLPEHPLKRDLGFGFGPLTPLINADLAGYTVPNPLGGNPIPLPQQPQAAFDENFASVLRGPDRAPDDSGQWGLALRYLAEDLNETEFGFYVINYHSRLPTVGALTASREYVQAGLFAAGAVSAQNSRTVAAVTQEVTREVQQAIQAGAIPPAAAPGAIAQGVGQSVGGIASALALDRYADGGEYFLEYPEDIQLVGLSFNTVLGASGWALQGEYSLRGDAPLQVAERKVLEAGLQPIITALGLSSCASNPSQERCKHPITGQTLPPQYFAGELDKHVQSHTPQKVEGYVARDVSQIQATATKVFGPTIGADSLAFVVEAALMHVHDMPDKRMTPLESPAGGILPAPPDTAPSDTPHEADADATSWGYRLAARLDYNNAFGSVNLFPYVQFLHDVSGNSPAPSGPFVEGRTALTLGVRADYLSRWQADLAYTRYAGDGNELLDRDFISASVKYSF